jgi:cytochrome c oxidase assembly factor CtaG
VAGIYARGWRELHARVPARFAPWRLATFLCGVAALGVAIASPLEGYAERWLQAHMAQHMLLLVVAPPLLWLGFPQLPLLRGLPAWLRSRVGSLQAAPPLQRLGATLSHPLAGWTALAAATWGWHLPAAFQLALRVEAWHAVEHACFLAAGLLFWWPVVQPWPSRARWPRWAMIPYLLLADLQNTALAALLTFSDRVLYPFYAELGGPSALDDQTAAGVLMWVPMSLVYLIPAGVITLRLLSPSRPVRRGAGSSRSAPAPRLPRDPAGSRTSAAAP